MHEIYLAGGCFWGTEHFFKQVRGVVATEVGFAGGHTVNPTYEEVYTDNTGHAETVRVVYDPSQFVTSDGSGTTEQSALGFLLEMFFAAIDPTSLNRQGHDEGTRYRTGIYCTDTAQLEVARQFVERKQSDYDAPIVVEVGMLDAFYPADERHQDYLDKNPDGYCHLPAELFAMARRARVGDPHI